MSEEEDKDLETIGAFKNLAEMGMSDLEISKICKEVDINELYKRNKYLKTDIRVARINSLTNVLDAMRRGRSKPSQKQWYDIVTKKKDFRDLLELEDEEVEKKDLFLAVESINGELYPLKIFDVKYTAEEYKKQYMQDPSKHVYIWVIPVADQEWK